MDRRTRNLFAGALLVVVILVGGAVTFLGGPGSGGPPPGTEAVVGVVTEVESSGLSDVCCFTLRTADGQMLRFDLSALENALTFPPGHLAEHQATASAIRVWWRQALDARLAIRIEDAD